MMARIGKALANLPGWSITNEELEQRVEVIEATMEGIVERVELLEQKAEQREKEPRERH